MNKPTIEQVRKVIDNPRTQTGWVLRASLDSEGNPCIVRMARIATLFPRDGAGRLTVVVTDWGLNGNSPSTHYIGRAGGYGYDKFSAALDGATIGGNPFRDVGLGVHTFARQNGWECLNVPG